MDFHFADDLQEAINEKGSPVCVGLDPVYARLPAEMQPKVRDEVDQLEHIEEFCQQVLQIVAPFVPAVKIQSAYFERYGSEGVATYERMIDAAHDLDLMVIGDVKRNDIGPTAAAYAEGHLKGLFTAYGDTTGTPDAVTINGYFGSEGIEPFIAQAASESKGIFVLVRTSNPSAAAVQDFAAADGTKFYEHMARLVAQMGAKDGLVGSGGYSCVGAVVGATYPEEARKLRAIMPQQIFLVPGYGAQGATAKDCAAAFKEDGAGAIVNASRSVIFAYNHDKYAHVDWKKAIEMAAQEFAKDIKDAIPKTTA